MKKIFINQFLTEMKLKTILVIFLITLVGNIGFTKPRVIVGNPNPIQYSTMSPKAALKNVFLNQNNIAAYFWSTGIFNQNLNLQNAAGFYWPNRGQYNSTNTACFTAGLCIAGYINTDGGYKMGQVMASYKGEYVPGSIISKGNVNTSPDFKMYNYKAGDNAETNPDVQDWGKMVPYGAPYVDVNKNGQYDAGIDIPGQKDAAQTLFLAMTDALISSHNSGEGFGGGVNDPLMYADVRWAAWCYTSTGLEDLQFVNWKVINKNDSAWTRTYFSVVVDPDLGDGYDDYIGCDPKVNLGYCYNGTNNDQNYGANPPAFGMDYFKGPINHITGDTLGLTSFTFFTNNGSSPPPCESDPNGEPYPAYLNMTGVKKDSTPYLDPTIPQGSGTRKTKFVYPGDPETNSGWTEKKGSIQNCGGDTVKDALPTNPSGDRRFIFSSGSQNFTVPPGDTQTLVLAQFVARGTSNVNSVTRLKQLDKTAQIIFDKNFAVTPPPPAPSVNYSFVDLGNGTCNINLNWDNRSEGYAYWDSIFFRDSLHVIYHFEGYEVYEIDKYAQTTADFTKPNTIGDQLKLLDIFDLRDGIGVLTDTFSTGVYINNEEQFAKFPIVPPYKMTVPAQFPDHGLSRSITLSQTQFSNNYSGQSSFIYGQEYQFAVVAYAYATALQETDIKKGFKVIRNSIGTQIIKITPVAPPAGSIYSYKTGDTLDLDFPNRDMGLMPIVKNQDSIISAKYRILFNYPDTSYNIMRMKAGQTTFDTLMKNLRFLNYKSTTDDSAKIVDGIFFNVKKLVFSKASPLGDYQGNVGVVRDRNLSRNWTTDSVQARRHGWEYSPAAHIPYKPAHIYVSNHDPTWQSESMSISYPTTHTYNNVATALLPEQLRTIKIVFTGGDTAAGQTAYRYCAKTELPPADPSFAPYIVNIAPLQNQYIFQDRRKVPFKVYEVDPRDSSVAPRQLNCAFLENNDTIPRGLVDGKWDPTADSTGSYEILYIFNSNYGDPAFDAYYSRTNANLYVSRTFDVMYVWAPALISNSSVPQNGDEFFIFPYYNTRPLIQPGNLNTPFYYDLTTVSPRYGDLDYAKTNHELENIRIVPNPYYGFSTLDRTKSDKFVTFRHLPLNCTIKLYTLNGDLVKTLSKNATSNTGTSSTLEWNLQNMDNVPVSSGIYIALIDAPGIGQKVMKIIVFTAQERINF